MCRKTTPNLSDSVQQPLPRRFPGGLTPFNLGRVLLRALRTAKFRELLLVWLMLFAVQGCAKWKPDPVADSKLPLPAPQMSPDSVTIETVLVRFPNESIGQLEQLWQATDESIVPLEHRRHLDKNGIRAGLLMGDLPLVVREQLQRVSSAVTTDALEYAGLAADADNRGHLFTCRAGRRRELTVRREIANPMTIVTTRGGALSGDTFMRATALFDLRAIPHSDGTVTLRLIPEVQHGEHQQAYVSSEFGVRPEIRRQQAVWQDLAIEAKLKPQELLVIASTQPPKALGQGFFTTRTAEQTEEHVVLLIRLAKTQLDDLFAPDIVEQARALTER